MPQDEPDPTMRTLKRTLDDFVDRGATKTSLLPPPSEQSNHLDDQEKENILHSPNPKLSTPARATPGLSVAGSSPSQADSPSPSESQAHPHTALFSPSHEPSSTAPVPSSTTPSSISTAPPAKKRKRLTEEEKKAKAEAEEARKLAKAKEDERRREIKREKEDERAAKAAEKQKIQDEKDQKRREQEAKEQKQMRLTSMFTKKPPPSKESTERKVKQEETTISASAGETDEGTMTAWYAKHILPFFVKQNVTLAVNRFALDKETAEAKGRILDEYLSGKREYFPPSDFDPVRVFNLPFKQAGRGRATPSVRDIMTKYRAAAEAAKDLEGQQKAKYACQEALKAVPMKILKFREDVRPPYIGTVSGTPLESLRKVARNPFSRDVLPLSYDYDSEAEWQEEDGEDLDLDDEDDEDLDDDEEMGDFLDDEDDGGLTRPQFQGGMEPMAIGPSWEDGDRSVSEPRLRDYRLEFCLDGLTTESIDPFSTAYWAAPTVTPRTTVKTAAKGAANSTLESASPMGPPPAPTDAFKAIIGGPPAKKPVQGLQPEMVEKLKTLLSDNPKLSKMGVIELFKSQTDLPKAQIAMSFESLTIRGKGRSWQLKTDG